MSKLDCELVAYTMRNKRKVNQDDALFFSRLDSTRVALARVTELEEKPDIEIVTLARPIRYRAGAILCDAHEEGGEFLAQTATQAFFTAVVRGGRDYQSTFQTQAKIQTAGLRGGTTITYLLWDDTGFVHQGNCGDGRNYLIWDEKVRLLTRDHTVHGDEVRTRDEALFENYFDLFDFYNDEPLDFCGQRTTKSGLPTRILQPGVEPQLETKIYEASDLLGFHAQKEIFQAQPHMVFALMSDGTYGPFQSQDERSPSRRDDLGRIIQSATTLDDAAKTILTSAFNRGKDNRTVVLARFYNRY